MDVVGPEAATAALAGVIAASAAATAASPIRRMESDCLNPSGGRRPWVSFQWAPSTMPPRRGRGTGHSPRPRCGELRRVMEQLSAESAAFPAAVRTLTESLGARTGAGGAPAAAHEGHRLPWPAADATVRIAVSDDCLALRSAVLQLRSHEDDSDAVREAQRRRRGACVRSSPASDRLGMRGGLCAGVTRRGDPRVDRGSLADIGLDPHVAAGQVCTLAHADQAEPVCAVGA